MKSISKLGAVILATLLLGGGSNRALAQTIKQQLVGTWTFVVTEATLPDGKKMRPFGTTPKGTLIFTEDGRFASVQVAAGIPKFASNSRVTGTAEENAAVVKGSIALFGNYTVDEATKTVTYKIESATFAGLGLPDSTKQEVADTFARVLAANIPSGVRVTSLTVVAGALVVDAVSA